MTTFTHATTTNAPLTATRRPPISWIALVVLMLLWSMPVQAQSVQYADASEHIAATPEATIATGDKATLPLHYGMPALKKRLLSISYPILAERFQVEGRVLVEYIVNEKGRVIQSQIHKSIGYGCDQAVLKALRHARFHPATDAAGQPQQARYLAAFDFRLED
ncbi:MAG TPA: energy transducer TonB [Rhodothermales bacterium]|nr:energy transducer TonB [Rhodothermales bacterium]